MVHDPDLLDTLEALGTGPFVGEVWRHMFAGLDPVRPNTRGARWNPPGVAAIYSSLERATATAEGDHVIASQPVRPRATRQVHRIAVQLAAVIDLTDRAQLAAVGVDDTALGDPDHAPCRRVGGAAYWLGADGLLVPSARASGTNLVIFIDHLDVDANFDVLETEHLPP
jgi:RES domain-containing protein